MINVVHWALFNLLANLAMQQLHQCLNRARFAPLIVMLEDCGTAVWPRVAVEFEPEHVPGFKFIDSQDAPTDIVGRPVDLNTPKALRQYFRAYVLASSPCNLCQALKILVLRPT